MDDNKKRDDIIRLILNCTREFRTYAILENELNRFQLTKKEDYQQSLKITENGPREPLTEWWDHQKMERLLTITEVKGKW